MNVTCIKVLEWRRHRQHGSNEVSFQKHADNLSSSQGLNQYLSPTWVNSKWVTLGLPPEDLEYQLVRNPVV